MQKRQTFRDPAHRFHKHFSNFHHKNPSQQPTSLLFDFPSTKTHHNNHNTSFFQQSLKKKKRAYREVSAGFGIEW
jgi:hypothetical protein